jgi:hypothetical protein
MTSVSTAAVSPRRPALAGPVWRVVRLHLVNRMTYLGIPWIIVGFALIVSVVVALLITAAGGKTSGMAYSWAVLSPLWYLVVVAIQAISLTFPFALGFSTTRREFYLGTALLFGLIAAVNAIAFTILTLIEKATGGFGVGAHMFTALWLGSSPWPVVMLSYFTIQLLVCFIGAFAATVYMRWRMVGMLVFGLSFALVILAVVTIATLTNGWGSLAGWFAAQGTAGIFAWLLVPAALAAFAGFFILRGATSKN